jgi:aminoacyl tRNA synthase complex-interacting multifunctional protein 1
MLQPIEQMQGKYLIAVCNLKPASMRGVKSFAMVLAATSADGKEGMGSVELVSPPEGSKPGDRVYFEGFEDVKALEQLPPKKKIFETVQPGFTTLETREAAWIDPSDKNKVHRIRTERGVCKAPTFVGASLS